MTSLADINQSQVGGATDVGTPIPQLLHERIHDLYKQQFEVFSKYLATNSYTRSTHQLIA